MHIYGYPVAIGLLAFATGAGLWHRGWLHRVAMGFFGLAAFLLAIGVTPWYNALARLTSTGTGTVVLLIVVIFAVLGTWYEMTHKRRERRTATHILPVAIGTALVMLIGNSARLLREAARSPGRTATALAQSVRGIRSGHAAHAVSQHQSLLFLAVAIGIAVAMVVLGGRHERRRGGSARSPLAIAGRPAAEVPAPRTALPPPNRRGR
jgi:drug/metabolite transporter (DMT)-like permease